MHQQNILPEQVDAQASLLRCLLVAAAAMGIENADSKLSKLYPAGYQLSEKEFVQAAQSLNIKVFAYNVPFEGLPGIEAPAVTQLKDGRYVVLGQQANGSHILVMFPEADRPYWIEMALLQSEWTGKVFALRKAFSFRDLAARFNFLWFMPVVLNYKTLLAEVMTASFFLQIFGLLMPLSTQVIIDKVIYSKGTVTLNVLAIFLLVACLVEMVMGILRSYLLINATNKIDVILGARLFRHIMALPLPYFEQRRVGDTLMRVAAMNNIREFLTGSAMTALQDAVFVFIFLAIMFYYSVPLTLIALVAIPLYIVQNLVATPIYQRRLDEVWMASMESNAFLVEAVTGINTVKSMSLEPQFRHKWEGLLARYVQKTFNSGVFNMILENSGHLIDRLSSLAILWYGGYMVMSQQLTLGELIAFKMLAGQANAPLLRLVGMWQNVQQALLSAERMGDVLHTPAEPIMLQQPMAPVEPLQGHIEFQNIVFRYVPYGQPILWGVNLTIPAGSKVGIVGRSGSGKSTLTKLLQRLYVPESGAVYIDGMNTAEMDLVWLRKQIGVVLQENFLFNASIRDNISVACPSAPMELIIQAAIIAGAHDFILELPEGYDTKVGEQGSSLSGGQRQRIAIARAIITNPRILIFDEATSALDNESERIIMDNLDVIAAGRTLIMIAHRLSTVRNCDMIVAVDQGQIVEQGTHEELMARQGYYYQLFLQQEGIHI